MKLIILSILVLASSCSKNVDYDKRKVTALQAPSNVNGPISGITNNPSKTIGGDVPNGLVVSVHKNLMCNDIALMSGTAQEFQNGLPYSLPEGNFDIYLSVSNSVDKICYGPYRNYIVDTTDPTITLDPSINTSPTLVVKNYPINGLVADNLGVPNLSFHKNNTCTDAAIYNASQGLFNNSSIAMDASIITNLSVTPIYAKVTDSATNSICQLLLTITHITGAATAANSYFTIEKTLIFPRSPVQNNLIQFFARDINDNPVSSLSPSITVTPATITPSDYAMPETSTLGTYEVTLAYGEDYDINITTGNIPFMTTRTVGYVTVTDNEFCYQNGGLAWTDHKINGSGTTLSPYLICSAAQLKSLAETVTSADLAQNYKLMIDLDLTTFLSTVANEFSIGTGVAFSGNFDGNNLTIKNYKPKANTTGFIEKMSAGSVRNLKFNYTATSIETGIEMSPFISSIVTTGNVILDNIFVDGSITCSASTLCSVGGVIGRTTATGAGQINITQVSADINAINPSAIGGVISMSSSPTASKIILNQINSKLTVNHSIGSAIGRIGGVISTSIGTTVTNAKANNIINVATALVGSIGGINGFMNSSIVENAQVIGSAVLVDVNGIGGIVGEVENTSTVTRSFSLMNIEGDSCFVECGKVLGQQNSNDNQLTSLYTSLQTNLIFTSIVATNVNETVINLTTQPGYFYSSINAPMSSWDFVNDWKTVVNNFPELIFANP